MASDLTQLFTVIILAQLFFSFAITSVAYSIPDDAKPYANIYNDYSDEYTLEGVGNQLEDSLQSQTDIPVIELGALVFYSGNIILDLLINFTFAIPQMITMLLNGIMSLMSVDQVIFNLIQLVLSVMIVAVYFFGLIRLVTSIRSGRLI